MTRLLLLLALVAFARPVQAERDLRVFFFGNSLIHHQSDSDETTVPYWLALMARAAGNGFAADGTWGFPADFARALPPEPQWRFDGVTRVMSDDPRSFRMAGFDTIVLAPPNFVQHAAPDADTLDGAMETLIGRTFDWAQNQTEARFLIYEGWAELGEYPPSDRQMRQFHDFNRGDYDAWYHDLVARLRADLPGLQIDLIPVAPVLSGLLTEGPLAGLSPADLYIDDAPHGTPTTYLLAAMVTYAALYGAEPPVIGLPETVAPALRDNYAVVAAEVWRQVAGAVAPEGASLTRPDSGLADPSVAFGLTGIDDWSTQQPFLDVMKTARPWIGHLPGQWGGVGFDELLAGGFLSPEGWPLAIPEGVEKLETLVLTDLPPAARSVAGAYVLRWQGSGDLSVGGRARSPQRGDHEIRFDFAPGEGPVVIALTAIDPADPIRDITLVRADRLDLFDAGLVFNPDWLHRIGDARVVRFMDWMRTNGSPQVTWADRPLTSDFSYAWRGVPVEVMVDLANRIGADPWFTLPHMADDDHVRAFAAVVHDTLDPRLRVHAEWSNEAWNFIFPQAQWARDQAVARWGEQAGEDGWMQYAGTRAAEVADIWAQVFADAPDRLVRVVATHTGWPGLEEPLLDAPLRQAEGLPPPAASFDAYAITGYFGAEIGAEDMAETLRDWIADGTAAGRVTDRLRAGSLDDLVAELWPHHAAVAQARGLQLLMYEGGTHLVGQGLVTEDEAITAFFTAYNYGPEMAGLYADLIAAWRALPGQVGPFTAFVDTGMPSRWGSWGALRHLDDMNPRWATLQAWNSLALGADRAPGTFVDGRLMQGTDAADVIEGSTEEDALTGGPGDDILIANGGSDLLNGGPGLDRAVLPGTAADWTPALEGAVLWMLGASEAVRLVNVEEVTFSAEPAAVMTVAGAAGP